MNSHNISGQLQSLTPFLSPEKYLLLKTKSLDNAILELQLAQPSWYMSHYTMLSKYGNCTHLLKIRNKLKIVVFTNKVGKNSRQFMGAFNKTTIIPLALVGYEMTIDNSALSAQCWLSTISYPMCTCGIINTGYTTSY